VSFELRSIDFDDGFEGSVIEKLKQKHFLKLYEVQGEVSLINAETHELSYTTYNKLNITIAEAEAEAMERDYTDKSTELKGYFDEMANVYDGLKTTLGVSTWAEMLPLVVSMEIKNSEYITKNFVLLPDEIKAVMDFSKMTELGSQNSAA
jgi:hypothetical protein